MRYQDFLNETTYEDPILVAYREGTNINTNIYANDSENWNNFVDPAFDGSAQLREALEPLLKQALYSDGTDTAFNKIINDLAKTPDLQVDTINFEK